MDFLDDLDPDDPASIGDSESQSQDSQLSNINNDGHETDTSESGNHGNEFTGFKTNRVDYLASRHAKLFPKTPNQVRQASSSSDQDLDEQQYMRIRLQTEINSYKKLETIDLKSGNPFNWWKTNRGIFPCLYEMALKILCCPPSSVESERLFSIGGNVISNKRASLKAETS